MEVQWNDVCRITGGKQIDFKTPAGEDVKGFCLSLNVDEMSVRTTDGKILKIARSTLQKLRMHKERGGQLKALHKGVHEVFWGSVGLTFSPLAPAGLVGMPASLAWGAVALPFCALNDLHSKLHGTREIRIL